MYEDGGDMYMHDKLTISCIANGKENSTRYIYEMIFSSDEVLEMVKTGAKVWLESGPQSEIADNAISTLRTLFEQRSRVEE